MEKKMFSSNKDYIKFDDVSIAANLQVFQPYLREVEELFNLYANIINPLIIEYEVEKTEFPVEILNEIRAIVSHLVRASVSSDDSEVHENIKKSKSHAKRAILDGYKYLCVLYDERYHEFFERYNDTVDWIASGLQENIYALDKNRMEAVALLRVAKKSESDENNSQWLEANASEMLKNTNALCQKYERAYNSYKDLYAQILQFDSLLSDLASQKKLFTKKFKLFN
jgi:hypothetical protein